MAAVIEIDEQNGPASGPALTHNVANTNMGSVDAPNLDPVKFPIAPGENTCEKWQLFHVTNMSASSRINNLRVWRSGGLGDGAIHMTNVSQVSYTGVATYTDPTTAISTVANQLMPSTSPSSANLGITGSLTASLTAAGYSDFFVHQIQTSKKALAGNTSTLNYQYDEFV